ncbi:uncharacterized protein [Aristolochia californica]|uniref:uncharacterized protein isoform X2 n=1 Tax=Aristolochia californica TaxID=171875 RepID=UPI0035D838D0
MELVWYHCCTLTGDCFHISSSFTSKPHFSCIKSSLQCTCTSPATACYKTTPENSSSSLRTSNLKFPRVEKVVCVASHQETRTLFLSAHIPLYLYPFLNTTCKTRPFEYLRLTSLGVIGALVKVDDSDVISFLLYTEIIPLCLHTMEMGSELSKTVATFIVQKILLDEMGLRYICATAERFFAVGRVLGTMVASLAEQQHSPRLLKHIIRCYLRLSDNPRACEALKNCLPEMLRDGTFSNCLKEDITTRRWLQQLIQTVRGSRGGVDLMLAN